MMASSGYDIQSVVLSAMQNSLRLEDRSHRALQLVCSASGSRSGYLYLVKPECVVLAAANNLQGEPPRGLEQLIQTHLERDRDRSECLTTMATGAVVGEPIDDCTVVLEGAAYELLLLRCVVGNEGQIAAVAAVRNDGSGAKDPHRPQLLAAVAAQLAQA
jgi:GAF domain-containing protein